MNGLGRAVAVGSETRRSLVMKIALVLGVVAVVVGRLERIDFLIGCGIGLTFVPVVHFIDRAVRGRTR